MNLKPTARITVLLAEDHLIVREGLRRLLETEPDMDVIGEAKNGRQAVELVKKLSPAIIVMDIAMPQLNGLEATRQILQTTPGAKILMLSAHSDIAYVEQAITFGASGFLLKQTSAHVLADAIREINKGNTYFSPSISKGLRQCHPIGMDRNGQLKTGGICLTPREAEVLQLVAEGEANKQIAAELGISIKTVEKHRSHLMQKLDTHDTASLTPYALAVDIIESESRAESHHEFGD